MRIFIRGTDKGNAALTALVLVVVLSSFFMSIVPRLSAVNQYTAKYKALIIRGIEEFNREVLETYDFN